MARLITVFGATGAQGGSLARAICNDPQHRFRLRAVTRHPDGRAAQALAHAGAQIVRADLDDIDSLCQAMRGAHGAYCVTSFWEHGSAERELRQAQNLAAAAGQARVGHVVWSTLEDTREFVAPGSGVLPLLQGRFNVPHYDAKGEANRAFAATGLPTTLLYTSFYWDNLIHFGMHPRRGPDGQLVLVLPIGAAKLPAIAASDIGACAFAIFAQGHELAGRSIGIAGEHLTGAQMAEQLTLALGEPVRHVAMPPEQYAKLGFPGAAELANMFQFKRDFERRYCAGRDVAGTRELHPRLATFAAWLAHNKSRLPIQAAA